MLVEPAGGEGDLRQREVVLGAGQRGVEHQDVGLRGGDVVTSSNISIPRLSKTVGFIVLNS